MKRVLSDARTHVAVMSAIFLWAFIFSCTQKVVEPVVVKDHYDTVYIFVHPGDSIPNPTPPNFP